MPDDASKERAADNRAGENAGENHGAQGPAEGAIAPPNHPWTWQLRTELPSRRGAHLPCMREILQQLGAMQWDGRDLFGIEMALEETLSNAIRHGNKLDESKRVYVDCKASPQQFWLRVEDEGPGFKPADVPDCRNDENLSACGGRGLMLIQAYMTRVSYNDAGNCVTLEKERSNAS